MTERIWKPDDDQIVERLKPQLQKKIAFFHGTWKIYENGCWHTRHEQLMRLAVKQELRNFRVDGVKVEMKRVKAIAAMIEDELFVPDEEIIEREKQQEKYVNLKNYLFNLDTHETEPHRPDLYFTTQLDFDYDVDADCPVFREFLKKSLVYPDSDKHDPTLYRLLLEALGYSVTAKTYLKSSFWLIGEKDSGKSTLVNLLEKIMGQLHATIDLTQLGTNRFLLSGIAGKRVISFTEGSSGAILPDGLYKALTGGKDTLQIDVKNRPMVTIRPVCKLWWAMNTGQMPRIADRSGATARRLILIPFNRTIPEKEQDSDLDDKLYAEKSGIFNEMMRYYLRLTRYNEGGMGKGFEPCKQSEEMKAQYISENDIEQTYVDEMLLLDPSFKAQSSILHKSYRMWCEERGFKWKSYNQIAQEWRRLGFKSKKDGDGLMMWIGLKLRQLPPAH